MAAIGNDLAPSAPKGETVGLQPWFPWPLSRWKWWTAPVRAERLAALRIGVAGLLLLDVLTTYLPHTTDFFGRGSLGEPPLYNYLWTARRWNWSLLYGVECHTILYIAMVVWIIALSGLLSGFGTRICAVAVWVLSTSFTNLNANIDNAGDIVRGILLFYLMLSPCGAVWSVDAWRRGRRAPVFVYPWPLRLIFLQMLVIYWANGLFKVVGPDWQHGDALYYVLGDAVISRWSKAQFNVPYWMTRALTWTVLAWEVCLPVLLFGETTLMGLWRVTTWLGRGEPATVPRWLRWQPLRFVTLCFGVSFHVGIWISMEIGMFAPYMLCLYLPLLPWEKLADGPPAAP